LKKRLDEVKLRAASHRAGGSAGPDAVPPPPDAAVAPAQPKQKQ
jgi:hypothetical protein